MGCDFCNGTGWVNFSNIPELAERCSCNYETKHCSTCDDYGYLRWNGEYAGWSKVDHISNDVLHKDIPCPDCNSEPEEGCPNCHPDKPGYIWQLFPDGRRNWVRCECSEP